LGVGLTPPWKKVTKTEDATGYHEASEESQGPHRTVEPTVMMMRNQTCPTLQIGNVALPQNNEVKYLSMHLDRRLTWAKHIKAEINQQVKKNVLATRKKINAIN
jgi:hypothetical protein